MVVKLPQPRSVLQRTVLRGFNVAGYELGLFPDANPADGALTYWGSTTYLLQSKGHLFPISRNGKRAPNASGENPADLLIDSQGECAT